MKRLPEYVLVILLFVFNITFIACGSDKNNLTDGDFDTESEIENTEMELENGTDGDLDSLEKDEEKTETEMEAESEEALEEEAEGETVEAESETDDEIIPRNYYVKDGSIWVGDDHYLYLRGANLSNLSKTNENHLYNLTENDLQILKESGINSIRMLTFWNAIAPAENEFDTAYIDAYFAQVKMLADSGFYVVIDMHQDLWGEPFQPHGAPFWACPEELKEGFVWQNPWWMNYISKQVSACFDNFFSSDNLQQKFVSAWVKMAEKVCSEKLVIGFDIINEPFAYSGLGNKRFDNETLKPLYLKVMQSIEEVCPGKLYFWEHSAGFTAGLSDLFEIPDNLKDRVVIAPHFYPTSVHEVNEEGYVNTAEQLEDDLMFLLQGYIEMGVPLWMGEYGGLTQNKGFDEYMRQIHSIFLKYHIGSSIYDYEPNDFGFALIDSNENLKDVFKDVFLTPVPDELPTKPENLLTDWDEGSLSAAFDCKAGKHIKVTTPDENCTCSFEPANAVDNFNIVVGSTNIDCIADTKVTMTCYRADEIDGDSDSEAESDGDFLEMDEQ